MGSCSPFGLVQKGYNNITSSLGNSTAQKFGYNGKELNEELGINWHDYGARNYDATIGRWMNIDNLAFKFFEHSPYHYTYNNPILFVDPDGNDIRISSRTNKEGVTTYSITITGKIVNNSGGNPYLNNLTNNQLQGVAERIASALVKAFTGESKDGKTKWEGIANISVASEENPLTKNDHAFRIVESGMIPKEDANGFYPDAVEGMADASQNYVYLNRELLSFEPITSNGKSFDGRASLERTSAHEVGHSGGLKHEDGKNMEGHLMHQTINPKAGWKLTKDDILKIEKLYTGNRLNQGKQKIKMKEKKIRKRKRRLGYKTD